MNWEIKNIADLGSLAQGASAILTLFITMFIWYFGDKQNKASNMQNTYQSIFEASFRKTDFEKELFLHNDECRSKLRQTYFTVIETYLNSIEIACCAYYDGKLDKKRFYKDREKEIVNQIIDAPNDPYGIFFKPEGTSQYTNIWRFYHEVTDKRRRLG